MKIIFLVLLVLGIFSVCFAGGYVGYDKYEEFGVSTPEAVAPPPSGDAILLVTGDNLLLVTGDNLLRVE